MFSRISGVKADPGNSTFLCAGGTADDVSDDMKDFLDWLIGKRGKSELVKALDNAVQKARNHDIVAQLSRQKSEIFIMN